MTIGAEAGNPRKSRLPNRAEFEAAIARLGPDARSAMLDDVLDALWEIESSEDVQSVVSVLQAWFVDTKVVSRPGFNERLAQVRGRVVTQDELLSRVGGTDA